MVELLDIQKLNLFISCRKLKDSNILSKTNPFVEVYEIYGSNKVTKLGVTEVISNNLNPDFITNFEVYYLCEEIQTLKFFVYNSDNGKAIASKNNFIGEAVCKLSDIQGSQKNLIIKTIKDKDKSNGCIVINTEQVNDINDKIMIQFGGIDLEDVSGIFHSFKPFFTLNRILKNGNKQKVYMSEFIKGNNVIWKSLYVSLTDLCNGDLDNPIKFELYDYHRSGNHELIGSSEFTIQNLVNERKKYFDIINLSKVKTKNYKNSGTLAVKNAHIIKINSFTDYIRGSCNISYSIAIDFTSSNGDPSNPSSLHYKYSEIPNIYEQALNEVYRILLKNDSNIKVPIYGFGGKINDSVSHCFNLNFNPQNPNITGIDNILNCYKNALNYVELSEPKIFSEFLVKIIERIENQNVNQNNQNYNVLVILTNGNINDMQDTVDLIVKGSRLAFSIIVVGIGDGSFEDIRKLDVDHKSLTDRSGNKLQRDIVQFVPFSEYCNLPQRIVKEFLVKISKELTNFYLLKNIVPNPPALSSRSDNQRSYSIPDKNQNILNVDEKEISFEAKKNSKSFIMTNSVPYQNRPDIFASDNAIKRLSNDSYQISQDDTYEILPAYIHHQNCDYRIPPT